MKKKQLEQNVLLGLLGLSILSVSPFLLSPSAEAAQTSLYDQYQTQQGRGSEARGVLSDEEATRLQKERELADLKEQVRRAQQAAGIQTTESRKAETQKDTAQDSGDVGAGDFLDRVNSILTQYGHQPVSTTTGAQDAISDAAGTPEPTFTTGPAPQAQAPKPAPSIQPATSKEGRYNFDWRGTPLQQTIYSVAKIAGKGIVINGSLDGSVYGSLHQATCGQALDYLSRAYNFNWMEDGNNIIVGTDSVMMQNAVLPVSFLNKEKVAEELRGLGLSNVYANSETGMISVTGTPYQIAEAKKHLQLIDHPVAQCLIVAQLIEIDHGKDLNLGFQYSLPTYSHEAESSSDSSDDSGSSSDLKGPWLPKLTFSASSQASRALNKGKVIARPMVMSLNGEEGKVQFGDKVPILSETSTNSATNITVIYQDVGTTLTITPTINEAAGDISLKVATEVSNIVSWLSSGQTRAPRIATRQATTSAHLHSGQSLVIGGLMSSTELDNLSGIPGLMNLPILGKLFSYHTRSRSYSEVYIMITPYIVTDNIDPQKLLKETKSIQKFTGDESFYGHVLPKSGFAR